MFLENHRTDRSPLPADLEPLSPGAGWGFDSQNLPATHAEEPPTASVTPVPLLPKFKRVRFSAPEVSNPAKYATPNQTRTRTTGSGRRNKRPPSVTSSEEASSDLSSDNSLPTPPPQAGRLLTSIYAPVGLPPAVPGSDRIIAVALPSQW